ncbi:hypothetical protein [Chryseobacterium sp. 2R14A]|uniref:hypothetical protein n=1 Tax=Chryseobacterium sp. 2R14A TaxID=3380353 RepID=UPI003CF2052F
MKLIGKTKEEIIALMADQSLEESGTFYLIYSMKIFFFIRKKIYIGFNKNGIADTIFYTQ